MLIQSTEQSEQVSIDMTPLIDMVFLLLIFFLVATTFHQAEREMKIALPEASTAGPISATLREIIVNVDAQGRIFVSRQELEPAALKTMIADAIKTNPDQKVTVRGDRQTPYANIVSVLDTCKAAGLQEPYLDTVLGK